MENNILIFTLCIVPCLILMWYIYTKDKIEKEPISLLITLFIGGIISAIISLAISMTLKKYFTFLNLPYSKMSLIQVLIKSLIVISLIEEISKWIINYLCTWKNKSFNHVFDQIVYSSFIALGFATFENILYGYAYSSYGIIPILLRGLISMPCHLVFGIYMGYYLGIARELQGNKKNILKYRYLILSLIIPVLLHFTYNTLLITKSKILFIIFIIYIILIYVFAYLKINELSSIRKIKKEKINLL